MWAERIQRIQDVDVYVSDSCYAAPMGSVTLLGDGEILASFREADRSRYGGHIDLSSRAVAVRSTDGGRTWDPATRVVIYDDADGIQDPCVRRLGDGTIVASFFKWHVGTVDHLPAACPPGRLTRKAWDSVHHAWTGGTFVTRSADGGRSWSVPARTNMWGHPPNLLRLRDGRLLCAYGFRRRPYGVHACVSLDGRPEWDVQESFVLDQEPTSTDFGYPASVELPDGTILTVWYHGCQGTARIRGLLYRIRS